MTVFKRSDSAVWQCKFTLRGVTVRESTGCMMQEDAVAWEARRRQRVLADVEGRKLAPLDETLGPLSDRWIAAVSSGYRDHKNNLSRIRKLFGVEMVLNQRAGVWEAVPQARFGLSRDLRVSEVTPERLEELKAARLAEGSSAATIAREVSLVRVLIDFARTV